jgi:RecJ-like exonuclease
MGHDPRPPLDDGWAFLDPLTGEELAGFHDAMVRGAAAGRLAVELAGDLPDPVADVDAHIAGLAAGIDRILADDAEADVDAGPSRP